MPEICFDEDILVQTTPTKAMLMQPELPSHPVTMPAFSRPVVHKANKQNPRAALPVVRRPPGQLLYPLPNPPPQIGLLGKLHL